MAILNIKKEPWERITIAGDFTNVLVGAETILDAPASAVTAVDSQGADVSETFLDQNTITVDGSLLKIRCLEGTHEEKYSVNFRIETSTGERWETNIKVAVKEVGFQVAP